MLSVALLRIGAYPFSRYDEFRRVCEYIYLGVNVIVLLLGREKK